MPYKKPSHLIVSIAITLINMFKKKQQKKTIKSPLVSMETIALKPKNCIHFPSPLRVLQRCGVKKFTVWK